MATPVKEISKTHGCREQSRERKQSLPIRHLTAAAANHTLMMTFRVGREKAEEGHDDQTPGRCRAQLENGPHIPTGESPQTLRQAPRPPGQYE